MNKDSDYVPNAGDAVLHSVGVFAHQSANVAAYLADEVADLWEQDEVTKRIRDQIGNVDIVFGDTIRRADSLDLITLYDVLPDVLLALPYDHPVVKTISDAIRIAV